MKDRESKRKNSTESPEQFPYQPRILSWSSKSFRPQLNFLLPLKEVRMTQLSVPAGPVPPHPDNKSSILQLQKMAPQHPHQQMKRNMWNNTSLRNCLSSPVFFFILENDWKKLRNIQYKRHFKTLNWTVIITEIRSVHPHCSFTFKHHNVQTIGSTRNSPLFTCLGYCLFDDCPVKVDDESSLKAFVTFSGDYCEQLKRLPLKGTA